MRRQVRVQKSDVGLHNIAWYGERLVASPNAVGNMKTVLIEAGRTMNRVATSRNLNIQYCKKSAVIVIVQA